MADWAAIKTEYITTDTSYRKLAEKHSLSATQIASVGKKEGWVKARKQHLNKTVAKAVEKTSTRESSKLAKLMTTTQKALDVVVAAFEDAEQFNRHIVEVKNGFDTDVEERVFKKVDTKALRDMTVVLKDLTGLMRDFYNVPTPGQAESQRIAAERLELEKRKADADANTDKTLEVLFVGADVEEWSG